MAESQASLYAELETLEREQRRMSGTDGDLVDGGDSPLRSMGKTDNGKEKEVDPRKDELIL